jgi:hypothetical protein
MRYAIPFVLLLLVSGLSLPAPAVAQNARTPRSGASTAPRRPTTPRTDSDAVTKPAGKPPARSYVSPSTQSEPDPTETPAPRGAARGASRFDLQEADPIEASPETTMEPASEEDADQPPPRAAFSSASRDNRSTTRPMQPSRQLLDEQEQNPLDEDAEPAPLGNRPGARSIEAQNLQIQLNDTPAGLVLAAALNIEHEQAITGYPIRLEQVLAASPDSASRRMAVRAYWNLVVSIADYHHALDEESAIKAVAAASSDKLLEAAAAAAEARIAETKLIVTAAQYDLAALTPSASAMPIPADAPVIGQYRTEFTSLFGRGPAPAGIKRLAAMLPLYSDQVLARGRAVYAASEAQANADDLQTFRELSAHRRAFLASVRDYNEAIADYALQLATPSMSVDTVTGMLIVRAQPAADSAPDLGSAATSAPARGVSRVVSASAQAPVNEPEDAQPEASVIKPRRIGGFRQESEEEQAPLGPDDEEATSPSAEPLEPDATEAPAVRRGNLRFEPKSAGEE